MMWIHVIMFNSNVWFTVTLNRTGIYHNLFPMEITKGINI